MQREDTQKLSGQAREVSSYNLKPYSLSLMNNAGAPVSGGRLNLEDVFPRGLGRDGNELLHTLRIFALEQHLEGTNPISSFS